MTTQMTHSEERTHVGADKIARYGWAAADERGEFRLINKRLLLVNRDVYQREGIKGKILELASTWSWIACGALIVAARDGKLWVVDGQHRKLAADRRSDIQDLPCMVFNVAALKDEAKAFLSTNTNRRNVSALDKFRASLAARDLVAIRVQEAIDVAGLRITTASTEARAFKSVGQALKLASADYDSFLAVLMLCGELAAAEACPVHSRLLSGLHYIHCRIDGGIETPRLRKRIKQIGSSALVHAANKAAAYYGQAGGKVCADGMMQAINNGLHSKFVMAD